MCGRYLLDADYEALIERYKIFEDFRDVYEKKLEIFPSQSIFTVVNDGGNNRPLQLIWGLKIMPKRILINSRIETVLNSNIYNRLKPCIIPATGYYEWESKSKQKFKISIPSELINFAGLYDPNTETVSIITMNAQKSIEHIHDRMPLMIDTDQLEAWLKNLKFKEVLKNLDTKKALNFSVENLEPTTQLSFFNDGFIE